MTQKKQKVLFFLAGAVPTGKERESASLVQAFDVENSYNYKGFTVNPTHFNLGLNT